MLSVSESAQILGVSSSRVRQLISNGTLRASKIGHTWTLAEEDVLDRLSRQPKSGRPSLQNDAQMAVGPNLTPQSRLDAEARCIALHSLYLQCKQAFEFDPPIQAIESASSQEEASFYMSVADFFLQQKQRELIAQGVY